jgi:hypothetical protein
MMDPLVEAFERLDVQMSMFSGTRVRLHRAMSDGLIPCLPVEMNFKSIDSACRMLSVLVSAVRDLVQTIDVRSFPSGNLDPGEYAGFQSQQHRYLSSLQAWERAANELSTQLTSARDLQAMKTLQMHYTCGRLMASTCLNGGRETLWDNYIPDFQHIVELGTSIWPEDAPPKSVDSADTPNFSLEMGPIPALFWVVLKCRDPVTRWKAVHLLLRCKHQEGAWDGPTIAIVAQYIIQIEHRGRNIQLASDLPEHERLYKMYFDLSKSKNVVYIKRRRFEVDGQWTSYEQVL